MNEKTELSDEQILALYDQHRPVDDGTEAIAFARAILAAASPSSKSTKERSDKDYAIEHAGYMATAARDYLIAVGAEGVARMDDEEEGTEATADKLEQAMADLVEAGSTLSNRIYEFEKRRDRALASSSIKEDGMNQWQRAVDDELVSAHLGTTDSFAPKEGVQLLIDWHVSVACDPAVNGGYKLVPIKEDGERAEPHCRVEEIHLTDEQRKQLTVSREVSIPGASSPPSPLGDTPDQQEQKR